MVDRLEAPPESVITIPGGLPGLSAMEQVVLIEPEDLAPILLLQSLQDKELSLPVIPAHAVVADYQPTLDVLDRQALGLNDDEPDPSLLQLVVVVVDSLEGAAACNLFAPIIIHPDKRIGRQCLQLGSDFPSLFRLESE